MPKPPSRPHVLRELRRAIGMTQAELAAAAGLAAITIKKAEGGREISEDIALRIYLSTGLAFEEVRKGPAGKLRDEAGRLYTAETFRLWHSRKMKVNDNQPARDARNLGWWMEQLLRAAAEKHGGKRYHPARAFLIHALRDAAKLFQLERTLGVILSECSPPVKWQPGFHTPSDLKAIQDELEQCLAEQERDARTLADMEMPTLPLKRKSRSKASRD